MAAASETVRKERPDIEFDDVTFTYPGAEAPTLRNVSFTIHAGEHVALVGSNGAGKSTIIKLLLGLYSPEQGQIRIGGVNIRQYSRQELADVLGVVFQDFCQYAGTIRDNVALGNASDGEVLTALERSRFEMAEYTLDTPLGKLEEQGVDLSGGQWQRLAVARSIVKKHAFLILDEPTAAMDPIAESRLYELFAQQLQGEGYIMISHRLGSARLADRILLLDQGVIAGTGSHDVLLQESPQYAAMWTLQSQWYTGGDEVCL